MSPYHLDEHQLGEPHEGEFERLRATAPAVLREHVEATSATSFALPALIVAVDAPPR